MKKLLFLLAVLLGFVSGIKAADLPTEGSGEFFIKNVETGSFLKGDCYWGTKAVVWDDPYALTLTYVSEGVYTIQSQQNNGGQSQYITSGEDPFVDGAAANMTFTEVDAVNHYYTINNGNGNLTAVQITEDGAQLYKVMPTSETSALAQWQIVSRAELVAEFDNASSTNPVVATFFMKDPGIDVKSVNANGWTTKTNVDLGGGGNAGHSAESWNKANFNLSQTVTGLPNGKYRVECYGYYRWNNGTNNDNKAAVAGHASGDEVLNAKLFAGTKEIPLMSVAGDADATSFCQTMGWADNTPNNQWQAAACFTKGFYKNILEDVVVTDGTLTIGVKKDAQAGTDWCVFDEFKLYYLGEDMSIYVEAYHNALTNAQGVDQTAPMNGEALTALQSALSTYASVDETSKDALLTATSALSGATAAATASINAYAAGKASLDKVDAILANTNVYTAEAYTTFGEAKLAAQNGYDNRTWTNEEAQAYGSTVFGTGWRSNATIDDFLISAWDAAPRDWSTYHINTWSTTGDSGNPNFVKPCFEYWTGDASTLADKLMTATLGGFAPGATYKVAMTVCAGVNTGVEASTAPTGVTLQLNDGEAVSVCTGDRIAETRFYEGTFEANATIGADGNLVIKLNVASTNASWVTWRDVKYTKIADPVDPTPSREAVAVKLTAAEGLLNEVMNVNVAQALSDAIAATAGYEESTDIDALEHMANDLDAALTAAQTSVGKYQEAADIINAAVTLDAAGQAVYAANETVLQIKAGYDARTLEAATVEQKELCQAALKTAVKAQTTDGADWTLLIDNPGFEGNYVSQEQPKSDRDIYRPEGWTVVWSSGDENDMTSLNSSCTQWNNFSGQPQPEDGGNNVYWARYRWGNQSSITLKQTINLPAGLYEVGAEGYLSNAVDGKATLSVKFGDEVALTDFTDAAWTKKAVVFSISETQDVEILYNFTESKQVEIKAGVDNFTLTSRAAADADDYAALNAAIKNAESMKVGFKAGEYAPYTNVAVLAPLAAAKAIDQTAVNAKSAVVIATSLLNDAQSAWVENAEDMPIVYNGTFAASENDGAPAGWETDNAAGLGGAFHARAFVLNPGDGNYDRLASFDQGDATRSAFYVRFDGTNSTRATNYTYGETVGYTMPLEAGVYRVKLMAGGWGQTQPLNVKFEDAESTIKGEQTVEMTNIADGSGVAASFNFLSEVADGDYKLVVSNGNIDANNAAAFSNVEITLEMTAAELAALREEIILLRTQVEGYTELPEPLATEAAAAVGEAYAYINEHECDPAKLNASKDRLQAVVDAAAEAEAKAAWQAQIAAAQALAADDDAVAVGKLRDAIEVATIIIIPTDEEKAALQAAVDQFNLDNADQESDQTAKVATSPDKWTGASGYCATQYAPAITTYDGRNSQLVENFNGATGAQTGKILYQTISGLTNGTYKVGFYANAFSTADRDPAVETGMVDGAEDVAYVYANEEQKFIVAHRATSTTENGFYTFDVQVTDGAIELGLAKDKAGTNWHTLQIYQLTWFTTAKALYALDKAEMEAAILLAGTLYEDPYKTNGKEELQQAIAEANAARISNHLNITEFEDEIAKLNAAVEAFKVANYVAVEGTYYVKNAAGKYMAAGHNWGTRGIVNETGLDLTLTPNNENKVAIDSRVYNGNNHFLGSNLYMDSGSFAWVIEQVGAEEYSIGNGAQYIGVDAEDNLALVNEPFAWQFLDAAAVDAGRLADGLAAMTAATADNGVDATFLLKDANFNRNDHRWEAWTVEFISGDNKNLGGGCDGGNGNGNAESFHSAFNIYQTIANAPAGVYKMTAQGFYRQDDAVEEAAPVFYIGDATAEVPVKTGSEGSMTDASYSFTEGLYTIDPIEFTLDADGDLTVGIKNGENVHQWVIFDNFRLTYYGPAPVVKYAITVADTENGTVVADKAEAEEGETVTLTATPAANYQFASAYYMLNEEKVDITIDGNTANFVMPAAAVNVVAAFEPKTDYTDYIVNANLTGTDGFDATGTKGIDGSGIVKAGSGAQYDFKQTISLPAGQYKLTAQAAYRFSGNEADEADFIANGETTKFASLYATIGEKTVSTLVQNRYDGASETDYAAGSGSVVVNEKYVPNSSAAVQAWFNAGQYVNEVTFNLTADGDVTIGIAKDAQPAAGDYTVIGPWTLTRLGDPVTMYAITVGETENGSVSVDKTEAASGETVTVTVTPDAGYELDFLGYSRGMIGVMIPVENNVGTFTMPAGAVTVNASFKEVEDLSYKFVPSEWGAGDAGRISPENVVADDAAGTITVNKSGANNVCLLFRSAKTYEVKAEQRYFVIKATGLSTAEAASYLWWLNNTNDGSQIAPTSIFEENGQTVFAWDCVTIPIGGKLGIEDTEFTDQGGWSTTFGMTLSDDAVPAVISYIGFQETIPEPVEEFAYEFVPSEWGAGDAGRISPENVVADDDMGTITVDQTGENNVALLFKTNKLYYVENVDYFVIKAKGVSTEAGASLLWWLNGKNDGGLSFEPTSTATEDDDTIILEWKISECGNIGENINPVGKSYLVGGDGWNTTFGLTQADALTPVVISYIGYGTKSATAISAAKSHNGEGALKDGKYLIKGEIIVVKNGKLYKANGQLK